MKILCGLTAGEIYTHIGPSGFSMSNAVTISNNLYKKRLRQFSEYDKIPGGLKSFLKSQYETGLLPVSASEESSDGTIKYLFRTNNGKQFESVFIPDGKRNTVCVSTQSGCRMGCPFCVSGRYGFFGNLSAGEIISQILSIPSAGKTTHVVFMGMGEPLDNIDNVLKACEILTAQWGMSLSPRNITVSTVGIRPAVEIFLERSSCNLTFSMHSPFPEERKSFIPAEKKYPAHGIIELIKSSGKRKGRRISIAYVMISGLNDSERHLEGLISLLRDSSIRVNLLPYHNVGNDDMISSSYERMLHFKHNLVISGISASVRKSRGEDISAACGLLAAGLGTSS